MMFQHLQRHSPFMGRYNNFRLQNQVFSGGLFTIYVDNLPNSVGIPWLRKFFGNFGYVVEAFLPHKSSRKSGNRFGFIRYDSSRGADFAISKANGIRVGKRYLIVERACYDRTSHPSAHGEGSGNFLQKPRYDNHIPFHQLSNSIPESSGKSLKNADRNITLNVQPVASEWLNRSVVVNLFDITTTKMIHKAFSDINFSNVVSIDEWINVTVKGRNHRVKVWEEDCDDFFNEKSVRDWVNVHLPNHGSNLTHDVNALSGDKDLAHLRSEVDFLAANKGEGGVASVLLQDGNPIKDAKVVANDKVSSPLVSPELAKQSKFGETEAEANKIDNLKNLEPLENLHSKPLMIHFGAEEESLVEETHFVDGGLQCISDMAVVSDSISSSSNFEISTVGNDKCPINACIDPDLNQENYDNNILGIDDCISAVPVECETNLSLDHDIVAEIAVDHIWSNVCFPSLLRSCCCTLCSPAAATDCCFLLFILLLSDVLVLWMLSGAFD
ncbi:hypothetical protein Vadar_034488 [Vaccinium darrowii]|uniref:Uncharacterized protein n=1 Tax=Vaccinium darrowii TaxID=229202 RepID=A0ACB7XVW3_9ERIC|nr:hypothetical protein Vadar_034488 [Vaccinium darrowii]